MTVTWNVLVLMTRLPNLVENLQKLGIVLVDRIKNALFTQLCMPHARLARLAALAEVSRHLADLLVGIDSYRHCAEHGIMHLDRLLSLVGSAQACGLQRLLLLVVLTHAQLFEFFTLVRAHANEIICIHLINQVPLDVPVLAIMFSLVKNCLDNLAHFST